MLVPIRGGHMQSGPLQGEADVTKAGEAARPCVRCWALSAQFSRTIVSVAHSELICTTQCSSGSELALQPKDHALKLIERLVTLPIGDEAMKIRTMLIRRVA